MKKYIFTDLAYEIHDGVRDLDIHTKDYQSGTNNEIRIFEMDIETEEQSKRYHRPHGRYLTLLCEPIWCLHESALISLQSVIARELSGLLSDLLQTPKESMTVLVVGLGNASFTVDAIGPRTAEKIDATRHLEKGTYRYSLATMTPGVLAETGMEAVEQIRGVAQAIGADAVLAIDALAASHYERVGATVQISDSGICPGSGVGNARKAITKETVGVPVVAIGVPTVVDAATLISDALIRGGTKRLTPQLEAAIAKSRGMFVCPKESDLITQSVSYVIADAINLLGGIKRNTDAYSEP